MHDPVHPVRVFVNEGFDVEGGEWDVPHGIVGVEGVRDVGVPLKADPVAVQVDGLESGVDQVWSLTQFYSVDFSKSRIDVVRFQQTHNQGLRQLLLTVSWDLRA